MYTDTIAAIATPVGKGALAVIRVSGPETFNIVRKIFRVGKGKKLPENLKERFVYYGFIVDPETCKVQDEVTLIFYRAPKSYTTEDMAEIICHGGFVSPQKVLSACIKAGARLAEPGEFTKRALLGGRVDLTEAEAVLDVIEARSDREHELALGQLSGGLKRKIQQIADNLREVLMLIEASIDFPEEEIEILHPQEAQERIKLIIKEIEELANSFSSTKVIREGIPIAIVGKPNVGKSSLLNALLKEERAIVTELPGTTRDTIEEEITIHGYPVRIIDTAGIRKTDDPVEKIGVERSIKKLGKAQLVLFVVDISRPLEEEDSYIASLLKDKEVILVINKSDLPPAFDTEDALKLVNPKAMVRTSAKLHQGIDQLQQLIIDLTVSKQGIQNDFLINERHFDVLVKAKQALENCIETLESGLSNEFVAIDLKEALNRLGEITGETTPDDILNMIFSRFCIGK